MKNATPDRLEELIKHNFTSLKNILNYNIENNIKLFRISSDIIPFGSSPVNTLKWWDIFSEKFKELSDIIRIGDIRVSMHPGQYTVLNSPNPDVVKRAIDDLNYHSLFLDCLNVGPSSKIILHIGGVYDDNDKAVFRFKDIYNKLNSNIKKRLVIENDDKSYNINDVLKIGISENIPVVYDNLHNSINRYNSKSDAYWIERCSATWHEKDGAQKIHYSQQAKNMQSGSHSKTIYIQDFVKFIKEIDNDSIDIMLEVKDKNISTIKCINTVIKQASPSLLLTEWNRYKYRVLESSQNHYLKIEQLIKTKLISPIKFYSMLEDAIYLNPNIINQISATKAVWDELSDIFPNDKSLFEQKLNMFIKGSIKYSTIKNYLYKKVKDSSNQTLLNSYYFQSID